MRKLTNLALLLIFIITLFSCESDPGDWKDNIKLSTKAVEFSALSDSITVTTGGGWWLSEIIVNEDHFSDFAGVNKQSDSFTIQQNDFVFQRLNKNTFSVKVTENPLNTQRIITVVLQNGDYFDRVTITQKAKH